VQWVTRFILFQHKRHPRDMGAAEVEQFLTHLAVQAHVSASTQNQALNALLFLYKQVLEIDLGRLDAVRARRPKRLPVVLAAEEVAAVLGHVEGADGVFRLMARQGVAGVTSPLDLLNDATPEQVQAALDATRLLAGQS